MSGPIVRSGTSPKFWENWEKIFGDEQAPAEAAEKKTPAPKQAKAAKTAKKKAPAKKPEPGTTKTAKSSEKKAPAKKAAAKKTDKKKSSDKK